MLSKPFRLLIVDDDEEMCQLITDILASEFEKDTLELTYTNSSQEAEQILASEEISIVITDMNMPKLNGYDIAKKCLATKSSHVIVLTGDTSLAVSLTCFRDGIFALLKKPISEEKLIHAIRVCVDRLSEWYEIFSAFQVPKKRRAV